MKKFVCLVLSFVLMFSLSNSVFAETINTESGDITKVNVEGTVTPLTLSVTIPTTLTFGINPNNDKCVTTIASEIKNNTPAIVDVEFLGFKSKNGNSAKVINNDTYTQDDWNKLGKKDTESKIALGIKDSTNTYWSPQETTEPLKEPIGTISLNAKGNEFDTKPIELAVKAGKAWTSAASLSYDMYLKVKISDKQQSSTEKNYVMATDADFSGSKDGEFMYIGNAEYVEIPPVIKGVPVTSYKDMFKGYSGLQLKGVKSTNKNIKDTYRMFYQASCTNTLDINELYFGAVENASCMFMASAFNEILLDKLDTSSVKNFGSFLAGCRAKKADVSNFDVSNSTSLSGFFTQTKLEKIDVSKWNTIKVQSFNGMFYDMQADTIDISNLKTQSETDVDLREMFEHSKIKTLIVGNFSPGKAHNVERMFKDFQTTTLDLSHMTIPNLTDCIDMFKGSLIDVIDMSGFSLNRASERYGMFTDSKVKTLYVKSQSDINILNQFCDVPSSCKILVK